MSVLEQCLVEVDGAFDGPAARRVAEAVAWVKPGGALTVDLSRVRELEDVALGALARSLACPPAGVRLEVLGLTRRQAKMLSWLGVELAPARGSLSPRRPGGPPAQA